MGKLINMDNISKVSPIIWAVAGGKGGTGKSFFTSAMGMFLSQMGNRTILIDSDLGAANLHSFLGIKRPLYSLSDFFDKNFKLEEIILETNLENLSFISGDINSFSPYSIKHFQKKKFFNHLLKLNFKYILIDLGAGSSLNTIDTFLLADKMVVVITPQITSYDNLYLFITKFLFRKIGNVLKKKQLDDSVDSIWKKRNEVNIVSFKDYISHLKSISEDVSEAIDKALSETEINIVLNQTRTQMDIKKGISIKNAIMKYFSISAIYTGFIGYDDRLWKSIHLPFSVLNSNTSISSEIVTAFNNLLSNSSLAIDKNPFKKAANSSITLTPGSRSALGIMNNQSSVNLDKFPYRVGRKSDKFLESIKNNNNLNLYDIPPYSISRSHFTISKKENRYYFEDNGSKLGTIVNGKRIGGNGNNSKIVLLRDGTNTLKFGEIRRNLIFSLKINEI